MIKYFKDRKREREIIHNCMEAIASDYEEIELAERASSICKCYEVLKRDSLSVKFFLFVNFFMMTVNIIIFFIIFIVNFFI